MSVPHAPSQRLDRLTKELEADHKALDASCRRHFGVSAFMFRSFKYLFYIAVLVMSTYLIQYASVEPTLAMGFAILLISGPEALETWLIRTGQIRGYGQESPNPPRND